MPTHVMYVPLFPAFLMLYGMLNMVPYSAIHQVPHSFQKIHQSLEYTIKRVIEVELLLAEAVIAPKVI